MQNANHQLAQTSLLGVAYMVAGIFALELMDGTAKYLMMDGIGPVQILGIRSAIIVSLMLLFYVKKRQLSQLKPSQPTALMVRGLLGFLAPFCFFKSLQTLPLADATVVFFSSTFMITALSWPLLREKVGPHRWAAVVLGFAGVIIAIEPEGGGSLISYAYCLAGSLAYAVLFLSGRMLSKTNSIISLVFTFNLGIGLVGAVFMPMVWQPMVASDWWLVLLCSLLALGGHICLTTAFAKAPVGVLAPFEYSALVWAVIVGYMLWGDVPSARVWLGACIIIACGLYVIYRESKLTKTIAG